MSCDPGKMNAPGAQFNEEEDVKSFQPDRLHRKEITGQELALIVRHELTPTQRAIADRCRDDLMSVEDIANGGAGDLETQFEEFALQFAIPPAGILFGQTHNQVFKLGIESGSTAFVLTLIGPLAPHQFPMPFEHRFGLEKSVRSPGVVG